jgi:regulatory associated protein of mTOR
MDLCNRVWNYEDAQVLNSFDNHQDSSEKGISKLCLINELDDNLLLAGSSALSFSPILAYAC